MKEIFAAIWSYRHFIVSSIKNDLRSRFARSKLGALWMILQPLAQVAIYALVLSRIMAAKLPGIDNRYAYVIYLMAGMIAWSLFAEVVTRSLTIFVDNGNLMKKMAFPRVCLPIIIAGSSLVNNLLLLVTAVGVFVLIGHSPSMAMLWLPLLIGINLAFALGLGLILGVLNVFVRDVAQFMMVVLQLLFWLTPIVYMPSIIPDRLRALLEFNPMAHMVIAFQDVLLYGRAPSITGLAVIAATATVLLLFSLILFRRSAPEMVDVL
ncbi:ABC transporter [Rhodanobacter sp. FW510-R12]|uniref:ABC transporter permease n=3 Tax=Rhodanobacter TaxID=75309 RepID=UPI0007A9EE2B|nr:MULTISPECIES: ABC transporter permease [unclassified Rhodanobacter]KZC16314.1 ABC transporter [Rhodanobacter sp. FW104-R8]KZC30329.1 ABC transporter [Rhodanobacter sp. FW510-R10]